MTQQASLNTSQGRAQRGALSACSAAPACHDCRRSSAHTRKGACSGADGTRRGAPMPAPAAIARPSLINCGWSCCTFVKSPLPSPEVLPAGGGWVVLTRCMTVARMPAGPHLPPVGRSGRLLSNHARN